MLVVNARAFFVDLGFRKEGGCHLMWLLMLSMDPLTFARSLTAQLAQRGAFRCIDIDLQCGEVDVGSWHLCN